MLEILISSSVLILVLAILRLLLRDRISARLQYALWLLALVRLLVPVSFFPSPVSVTEAVWPVTDSVRGYSLQTGVLSTDVLSDSVTQNLHRLGVHPEWDEYVSDGAGGSRIQNFYSVRQVGHLVWYAGSLVMAVWFLCVNVRLARRLKKNRKPYDYNSVMPVYVAEGIPSPCLFGLLRTSIYLTERATEDDTRARQIIAHELTHYRHGDMIWSLLRSVCLVIWWFNPLVWLAATLSRQDCELACDEGTIKALGEEARFDYGRTLVGMAKVGAKPSDLLCGATTMTTGKKSLKARVARIANAPKMSVTVAIIVLLIAAAAVGCTFSGTTNADLEREFDILTAEPTPTPMRASDSDAASWAESGAIPPQLSLYFTASASGVTTHDEQEIGEIYDFYRLLLEISQPLTDPNELPADALLYTARFSDVTGDQGYLNVWSTGFEIREHGWITVYRGLFGASEDVCTYYDPNETYIEQFEDIIDEWYSKSADAVFIGGEPLGGYDREYWEEVERELGSFVRSDKIETSYTPGFDPELPEDDIFGPLTLEDYVYGTDSWQFRYDGEAIMTDHDPYAWIKLIDDNDRVLWIMDDADALMIEEADGSITWVDYAGEPVDCADMIRHLLPWARGEFARDDTYAPEPGDAIAVAVPAALTSVIITYLGQDEPGFSEPVGQVIDLDFEWRPATYQPSEVRWESSDESVATVDREGRVTTVAPGYCEVTLWVDNVADICEVWVF